MRGANYHSERSRAGQIRYVVVKSAMIRVSEEVCFWKNIRSHRTMCFLISYANCFSTKPNNSVHVRATRLYHHNDDEAVNATDYRKKCVGRRRKTAETKTTSKTTSWNKHETCRNGHDVTTSWCKQEPKEPDAPIW